MPLLLTALTTSPGIPGASGSDYPPTRLACAQAWAAAMQAYASGVLPASATVGAAAATLTTALDAAFGSPTVAASMESAFLAFATTLGGGMAGFAPLPPPAPIGFATMFLTTESTRQGGVTKVANAIHAWMLTGSSTLIVAPFTLKTWT